jgi:cytochrome c-type protein NapC
MKLSPKTVAAAFGFASVLGLAASASAAPSWSSPAKGVDLLYPGQSSWEWIMTDHPGAEKFKGGKNCAACHTGDEANMGALMASGKKNEPSPIAGKPGSVAAKVQFSHDADNLYVRISFSPGNQPNAHQDAANATKVTMMIAGPGVPEAARAGCWGMCHDDSAAMPSGGAGARTMYLSKTRAALGRTGGGDALKPAAALGQLKAAGYLAEFWQAKVNGASATGAEDVVFDKRAEAKPSAVSATGGESGGVITVTLSRKLNDGVLPIEPGKRYSVAFAIHGGHTAKRFHYVSFERSMVLDAGAADFIAK